jgi:uncharacterized protein DUF6285
LLDAVAEYLFGDLRPEVPREQRFKVLAAANVCAVVAREIRAGEGPTREDLALFRDLLGERGEPPNDPETLAAETHQGHGGAVASAAGRRARRPPR